MKLMAIYEIDCHIIGLVFKILFSDGYMRQSLSFFNS